MEENNDKADFVFLEEINIQEPKIEIENTIFEILINAHKLTHVKENIYKSKGGRKYHLTKYGLEPAVVFNAQEETKKIQHELERVSDQLVTARRKIEKMEMKNNDKIDKLTEKVQNQAIMIKRLEDISSGAKETKNKEKIALLKGELKMKNVEVNELKVKLATKPIKNKIVPKQMSKAKISQVTNNINAILDTPLPDGVKVEQIKTLLNGTA